MCCPSPEEDPYRFWEQEVKAKLWKFEFVVVGGICPFRTCLVAIGDICVSQMQLVICLISHQNEGTLKYLELLLFL